MIPVRSLYILKEELFCRNCEKDCSIPDRIPNIRTLKKQGFKIFGYARKSEGVEDHETRLKLLSLMCRRLIERSLVDHGSVSYNSLANDPLAERDMEQKDELLTHSSGEGNTQEKICLVALDYAGLSTNSNDLHGFLTQHPALQKIMIDNMPTESIIHVFERDQL